MHNNWRKQKYNIIVFICIIGILVTIALLIRNNSKPNQTFKEEVQEAYGRNTEHIAYVETLIDDPLQVIKNTATDNPNDYFILTRDTHGYFVEITESDDSMNHELIELSDEHPILIEIRNKSIK